ncbi:DUF4393 domain-containing protein [Listeria booriae]|uniref:DUF4393 domain-containing protein n=1 Tax=Listeria booriae TaxID=1552123 RepID=A0A7X1A3F9_9LIST|nr:DUF4393 domain-containing protein [Listeria booriae]
MSFFKNFFANLLSKTLDNKSNSNIPPCFPSILKEPSPKDTEFLLIMSSESAITHIRIYLTRK